MRSSSRYVRSSLLFLSGSDPARDASRAAIFRAFLAETVLSTPTSYLLRAWYIPLSPGSFSILMRP